MAVTGSPLRVTPLPTTSPSPRISSGTDPTIELRAEAVAMRMETCLDWSRALEGGREREKALARETRREKRALALLRRRGCARGLARMGDAAEARGGGSSSGLGSANSDLDGVCGGVGHVGLGRPDEAES